MIPKVKIIVPTLTAFKGIKIIIMAVLIIFDRLRNKLALKNCF